MSLNISIPMHRFLCIDGDDNDVSAADNVMEAIETSSVDSNPIDSNPVDTIVNTSSTSSILSYKPLQFNPCGFAIVGDNIDKNIRPSFQREDRKTQSLHYFHSYAFKNRIDISSLSDTPAVTEISPESILPSRSDFQKLLNDFEVLVSRYINLHI